MPSCYSSPLSEHGALLEKREIIDVALVDAFTKDETILVDLNWEDYYQKAVDVGEYAKGIYNLQLLSDEGIINKKIVVE